MRSVALLFFVLTLCSSLNAVERKLILATYHDRENARMELENLKTTLDQDFYRLYEQNSFQILVRPSGEHYILCIEPIENYPLALTLHEHFKKHYPDAFIVRYHGRNPASINLDLSRTLIQSAASQSGSATVTEPTEPAAIALKHLSDVPGRPLHIPSPKAKQTNTALPASTLPFLFLTALVLIVLVMLLWRQRKKARILNIETELSPHREEAINELLVDIHSHLIPRQGEEIGPHSIAEAIDMIKAFESIGYRKIITTPHLFLCDTTSGYANIEKALLPIKEAIKAQQLNIIFEVAPSYHLDETLIEALHRHEIITFDKEYLLLEPAVGMSYDLFSQRLEKVLAAGYKIILLHPERYAFMCSEPNRYRELKTKGTFFQVDLDSLLPEHSDAAVHYCTEYLIENGMIDFLGSNASSLGHVHHINAVKASGAYKNIFRNNTILNNYL